MPTRRSTQALLSFALAGLLPLGCASGPREKPDATPAPNPQTGAPEGAPESAADAAAGAAAADEPVPEVLPGDVKLITDLERRLRVLDERIALVVDDRNTATDEAERERLDERLALLTQRRTAAARALAELVRKRESGDDPEDAMVDLRRAATDAVRALERAIDTSKPVETAQKLVEESEEVAESFNAEAVEAEEKLEDAYTQAAKESDEALKEALIPDAERSEEESPNEGASDDDADDSSPSGEDASRAATADRSGGLAHDGGSTTSAP